jgi:hypothetical protein
MWCCVTGQVVPTIWRIIVLASLGVKQWTTAAGHQMFHLYHSCSEMVVYFIKYSRSVTRNMLKILWSHSTRRDSWQVGLLSFILQHFLLFVWLLNLSNINILICSCAYLLWEFLSCKRIILKSSKLGNNTYRLPLWDKSSLCQWLLNSNYLKPHAVEFLIVRWGLAPYLNGGGEPPKYVSAPTTASNFVAHNTFSAIAPSSANIIRVIKSRRMRCICYIP